MAVIVRRTPRKLPHECTVMGIDPSTKTGVVVLGPSWKHFEVVTFPELDGYRRLHAIAGRVGQLLDEHKPEHVFIEGIAYGNRFTIVLMAQIGTMIRSELWKRGKKWWDVPPRSLKHWTTGAGKADKKGMAKSVKARWDFAHRSDDIVDAFALAKLGQFVVAGNNLKGVNENGN